MAFGIQIDKDIVRRILGTHYRPKPDSGGPFWLTLIGHVKDSVWSLDLIRCESEMLRTHWVLVIMDEYTRRIIGFGVHRRIVDGVALCQTFNRAIRGPILPKYLSSDHDPLWTELCRVAKKWRNRFQQLAGLLDGPEKRDQADLSFLRFWSLERLF